MLRHELRVGRALRHVLGRVGLRRVDHWGRRKSLLPFSKEVFDAFGEYLIVTFVLPHRLEIFDDPGVLWRNFTKPLKMDDDGVFFNLISGRLCRYSLEPPGRIRV